MASRETSLLPIITENLENYSKKSNLIIMGIPVTSYVEAISSQSASDESTDHTKAKEKVIITI